MEVMNFGWEMSFRVVYIIDPVRTGGKSYYIIFKR